MTHGISFSREGGGVGEVARKSGSCHEVMVVHENFLIHKSRNKKFTFHNSWTCAWNCNKDLYKKVHSLTLPIIYSCWKGDLWILICWFYFRPLTRNIEISPRVVMALKKVRVSSLFSLSMALSGPLLCLEHFLHIFLALQTSPVLHILMNTCLCMNQLLNSLKVSQFTL